LAAVTLIQIWRARAIRNVRVHGDSDRAPVDEGIDRYLAGDYFRIIDQSLLATMKSKGRLDDID